MSTDVSIILPDVADRGNELINICN
ncbi:Protein of unknown function [Leuconostoc citreum]|nr:Protein of unknown function [Leuconostoc citreum]